MGAWRWALKLLCSHQGGLLQRYLAKNPLVAAPKQPLPLRVVLGEIGANAKEPQSQTAEALTALHSDGGTIRGAQSFLQVGTWPL